MITSGFSAELVWQERIRFEDIAESDFLREAAWVILCSGFRESILRKLFSGVSLCFCDWESAAAITENAHLCKLTAMDVFKNQRKIDAIVQLAGTIAELGFPELKRRIAIDPIPQLQTLPYIGPITSWHLAKNLGFNVAKPDRHLAFLAKALGFSDAHCLCNELANATGDADAVIDLALWRYSAQNVRHINLA
jgi:hypothetical protein